MAMIPSFIEFYMLYYGCHHLGHLGLPGKIQGAMCGCYYNFFKIEITMPMKNHVQCWLGQNILSLSIRNDILWGYLASGFRRAKVVKYKCQRHMDLVFNNQCTLVNVG